MVKVLIASGSQKEGEMIAEMLKGRPVKRLLIVTGASQARRYLNEENFELLIINTPLKDESGFDLALKAAGSTNTGILLITEPEEANNISCRLDKYGVFVLAKPLEKHLFLQATRIMEATYYRLLRLQLENKELQRKIQDINLVHRAKCALIQYLDMTEEQAHKYIERQAMDQRVSKREVAKGILRTYESEGELFSNK